MMIKGIQPWRRIAGFLQAAIMLGTPFITVGGESALRFDVSTLRLHFFGATIWMDEFFIVLISLVFLTFLTILITLIFGRVWCGWLCPQTVLISFTSFIDSAKKKRWFMAALLYIAVFLVSGIVAVDLIWYFVSPYEFLERFFQNNLGAVMSGFWIVLTSTLFLNFAFLRQTFCATVCPYAKLQSTMYDNKSLVIAFDKARKEECINCMACVRTCPVQIDIRNGLNAACINCAECIDACTGIMDRKMKRSLVNYSFGLPGETGKIIRQNVMLIGSVTFVFFVFLVYLTASRVPIDMTILPNYSFPPRILEGEEVLNSFLMAIKNRGEKDITLEIAAQRNSHAARVTPHSIMLKAGEDKKVPIYVGIREVLQANEPRLLDIRVVMKGNESIRVVKRVAILLPDG